MSERPIYNLDAPFTGCASTLIFIIFGPLLVWIGFTFGRGGPQANPTAQFDRGAQAMCMHLAEIGEVPAAQQAAFCQAMGQAVNP